MKSRQEYWAKHIEGWRRSGLTARDYAASAGINAGTLKFRKYLLGKQSRERAMVAAPKPPSLPLVEVLSSGRADARFELEFVDGKRLWVPTSFEVEALRRLLGVLERTA